MFKKSIKQANVEMVMMWFKILGNGIVWKPVRGCFTISLLSFLFMNKFNWTKRKTNLGDRTAEKWNYPSSWHNLKIKKYFAFCIFSCQPILLHLCGSFDRHFRIWRQRAILDPDHDPVHLDRLDCHECLDHFDHPDPDLDHVRFERSGHCDFRAMI